MMKILFLPFSLIGGLLAGIIGRRLFQRIWSLIDREEPPEPEHRDVSWGKLIAALMLEGAIFRATRGAVDKATREAFSRLTGSWPGEERPEPT
jgi:hypothetical protein